MVEGHPYGLGEWGVAGVFMEAGRLFKKYFTLLAPFMFAFVLPTALIQLLEVFGVAWWAAGQNPFLPPGPHPFGHVFSKVSILALSFSSLCWFAMLSWLLVPI